jgi:hypothetical protein
MSLKRDFLDWKEHPITQRVFAALKEQEENLKNELADSAGISPENDRRSVGYIQALRDFYLVTLVDEEDKND